MSKYVMTTDTTARINQAIAVCQTLTTDDGRKLDVAEWCPVVKSDDVVVINVQAIVRARE